MAEGGESKVVLKLPEIFTEIWKIYDILERTEESTSSDKNQVIFFHLKLTLIIHRILSYFEKCVFYGPLCEPNIYSAKIKSTQSSPQAFMA